MKPTTRARSLAGVCKSRWFPRDSERMTSKPEVERPEADFPFLFQANFYGWPTIRPVGGHSGVPAPRADSAGEHLGVENVKCWPARRADSGQLRRYFSKYTTVVSVSAGSGVGSP